MVTQPRMGYAKFVLRRHPSGVPKPDDFQLIEGPIPEPGDGEVVVEHTHLGLAPAARVRMSENVAGYSKGMHLGDTVYGAAAGRILASRNPAMPVGANVASVDGGWQTHAVSDGSNLTVIDTTIAPASVWLGALGISGFTGYVGLEEIAHPKPGETLVVSAAAGAVGSFVAQMARLRGCRVVGIAGGLVKCRHVEQTFSVPVCVNYRNDDFRNELARACPEGVNVYFDNVGGRVRDGVWPLMATYGRVVVCGQISQYSLGAPEPGPDWYSVMIKRLTVQGLYFGNYLHRRDDFRAEVSAWVRNGDLVPAEAVIDGFGATPGAFIGLLSGRFAGKVVIKL